MRGQWFTRTFKNLFFVECVHTNNKNVFRCTVMAYVVRHFKSYFDLNQIIEQKCTNYGNTKNVSRYNQTEFLTATKLIAVGLHPIASNQFWASLTEKLLSIELSVPFCHWIEIKSKYLHFKCVAISNRRVSHINKLQCTCIIPNLNKLDSSMLIIRVFVFVWAESQVITRFVRFVIRRWVVSIKISCGEKCNSIYQVFRIPWFLRKRKTWMPKWAGC